MNYKFPKIEHIDQVREAIKNRSEFNEYNRGDFIVFNYFLPNVESFPIVKTAGGSAKMRQQAEFNKSILRECRGLIFDKNGKVLSRRFHKFFNLGEREETLYDNVNWKNDYTLLEKLDGSMITPLMLPSGLRWGTKMGLTDVADICENYVDKKYKDFAEMCYEEKITPIFEFISPSNRIVLQYEHPELILLAIRNNLTGEYFKYETLLFLANTYNIPVVKPYLNNDLNNLRNTIGIEGVVVRFNDGHMIKVKTDWYCTIHKIKENLLFEKNVIKIILEDKLDDILPHLLESDRNKLIFFQKELLNNIDENCILCEHILARAEKHLSRKDFAVKVAPTLHPIIRSVCFTCWDNTDLNIKEVLINNLLPNCNSSTNIEHIRDIIGVKWDV